jgi:hypothetical protein
MGYELHLTRAEHWVDSAEHPILQDEWEHFACASGDLDDAGWVEAAGMTRSPVFSYARDGVEVSLTWRDGQVDIAGVVSKEVARDLSWLATAFDARLMGDDGESY